MFFIERFRKLRARMRADAQKGSAAIEFAMVAPIFFVLLMGTFEAAIIFFSQSVLQNAVADMGRQIRTGQAGCLTKDGGGNCVKMTKDEFRAALCGKVSTLFDCGKLVIDVKPFSDYTGLNSSRDENQPLDADGQLKNDEDQYDIGDACQVVLARVYYPRKVATPVITWFLVNMADDRRLVTTATAFRTEPWTTTSGGC
jgi:Flp pilus assembly protein TadG